MDYWLSPCSPTEEQRDLWSEGSGEFQMKEDPAGESPMGGKGAEGKKLVFVETPSLGEQQQPATEHAEMETEVELSTSAKEEESVATSVSSTDGPGPECYDEMRSLFHRAYLLLNPSALFRFATYLFAERKLVVFFWMHFLSTMIIWLHFFLIKFDMQKAAVPDGAPFYWWKRLAPPLEFGSMHAILFQMALIPLTMARYTLANVSSSWLKNFLPFNRMMRIHIHLGYTMAGIIFVATCFFFAFFGVLCAGGQQDFCDKFTSEIMITGYVILSMVLIVVGTSYFRHSIPYEVFYAIHHIIFVLYILTIAHTMDVAQRSGKQERSQTFKWFSLPLLYYLCDRSAMHFLQKFQSRIEYVESVHGKSSRMLLIKLRRPALFRFEPGQYAFLRVPKIDVHWHPFSIASGPSSSHLQFYIEVYGEDSWTDKLWKLVQDDANSYGLNIEIMGPYGTGLANTEDYSHCLAIGTGTGVVPVLSMFKQQVRELMRLAPKRHFEELNEHQKRVQQVELAEEPRKGSLFSRFSNCFRRNKYKPITTSPKSRTETLRDSIQQSIRMSEMSTTLSMKEIRNNVSEFKAAAFSTTRSIYGVVLLGALPVFGIGLIGCTISWNTVNAEVPDEWFRFLQAWTVLFQAMFAIVAIFVWDVNFFVYLDAMLCLITPFADWFWFLKYENEGVLPAAQITTYCLLTGYMTLRSWVMVIRPRNHKSWRNGVETSVRTMERLDVVWVTRSSSLVSKIAPDINEVYETLVAAWGRHANQVCRFQIYVTDSDPTAVTLLKRELEGTTLYKNGMVRFGRPDIGRMIDDHSIEMICTRKNSHSLLAYVGSPELAREIHECKLFNDMKVAITGNKKHQMEFVFESYGGVKSKRGLQADGPVDEPLKPLEEEDEGLSKREKRSFANSMRRLSSARGSRSFKF